VAKNFDRILPAHRDFIGRQKIFFTATARATGRVNISPREAEALRILGDLAVVYLDRTGSGNETAAHLRADGRMTIMLSAFEGPSSMLRLYGRGRVIHRRNRDYQTLLCDHFEGVEPQGAREMVHLDVDLVRTSCGFGVPFFDYRGPRDQLERWAASKDDAGLQAYRREKNVFSLDGLPTGLFDD
jgi:predicted pyridoxine 5'-phosphate oxidase superfamily flavin-nucleotide-binding protein